MEITGEMVINRSVVEDRRLSWKAKALWHYAANVAYCDLFNASDLIWKSSDNEESILSGLQELLDCGYIEKANRSRSNDDQQQKIKTWPVKLRITSVKKGKPVKYD